MKVSLAVAALLSPVIHAQTHVDLSQAFNADVFLEQGGTGLGDPLDSSGRRIDATTLPSSFVDGSTVTSTNGRASFRFAPLKTESRDAVRIEGQTLEVTDGRYSSVDLALLSAPGAFSNPFSMIDFIYTDGSTNSVRLGPVAGWFSSPNVYDNALFRYSDQSGVTEHVTFPTNGENDIDYLFQSAGNAISGGWRFADGNGYLLYKLDTTSITNGKLGITIGNNFVVSIATNYNDPDISRTEGYTQLASSMEIYNGVDHHSLGNLKEYEFDVTPYLAAGTGELYILLTDGSTSDGWGPFVQRIRLFEGTARTFEERLRPTIDSSDATVYANFQIASDEETPFLYDNSGSGPSNRGHRFADGNGSLTYRLNLPDNVTDAKMTVDMENNFVVSIAGPATGTSYAKFTANTETEATYLIEAPGTATQPNARFADGNGFMIYEFNLPDDVATAFARVQVGNQFVISAAAGEGEYTVLRDYVAETGNEIRDNSNLDFHTVNLTPFLGSNPGKIVRIRLTDGVPVDGWGPYLRSIEVVDSETAGALNYSEVLNSQTMFGEDVHNEVNRGYYTIDLGSVLTNNNPNREVNIRFTDGSTFDGWGPSLYWMSVYSGEIEINADSLVFPALKSTLGDPASRPVGLLARNYPLDPSKTLTAIRLPEQPIDQSSTVYLLAATLNATATVNEPELQVARVDADSLRVSWPSADGFRLQFSTSLGAGAQWTDSNSTVQNNGGTATAEVNTTGQTGFYRLIK